MPPEYRRQSRSYTILWMFVVLVLLVLAFYLGSHFAMQPAPQQPVVATSTPVVVQAGTEYYANPSEWQTYTDTTAGYSVAYPITFSTSEPNLPKPSTAWLTNNSANTTGLQTFTLTTPAAFEPQTNFLDATLSIGYSMTTKALQNCLTAVNGEATSTNSINSPQGTDVINNATFTVFTLSNPGAGNLYDTTSYRTIHAGACYAVEYTIHSAELGNYPTSYNLQQFDEAQVSAVLDRIVGTFTFL